MWSPTCHWARGFRGRSPLQWCRPGARWLRDILGRTGTAAHGQLLASRATPDQELRGLDDQPLAGGDRVDGRTEEPREAHHDDVVRRVGLGGEQLVAGLTPALVPVRPVMVTSVLAATAAVGTNTAAARMPRNKPVPVDIFWTSWRSTPPVPRPAAGGRPLARRVMTAHARQGREGGAELVRPWETVWPAARELLTGGAQASLSPSAARCRTTPEPPGVHLGVALVTRLARTPGSTRPAHLLSSVSRRSPTPPDPPRSRGQWPDAVRRGCEAGPVPTFPRQQMSPEMARPTRQRPEPRASCPRESPAACRPGAPRTATAETTTSARGRHTTPASRPTRLPRRPTSRRPRCPHTRPPPTQRSSRSSSRTSAERSGAGTGGRSVSAERLAGRTRPAATSAAAPVAVDGGTRTAISRPRSVIPSVSPRSTRRRAADARCWSSLTPIVFMCGKCSTKAARPSAPRPVAGAGSDVVELLACSATRSSRDTNCDLRKHTGTGLDSATHFSRSCGQNVDKIGSGTACLPAEFWPVVSAAPQLRQSAR